MQADAISKRKLVVILIGLGPKITVESKTSLSGGTSKLYFFLLCAFGLVSSCIDSCSYGSYD